MMSESAFRKSTFSAATNCVEVGRGEHVGVRDTQQRDMGDQRTTLEFSPAVWRQFTSGLKAV